MIFSTGVAMVTSVFPKGDRGKALGITAAMTYAGLSLGPIIGGILTQHLGWQSIFLVTVPLGITIIILILKHVSGEWAEAKGEKFDLSGSLIYGLALAGIISGLSFLPGKLGGWILTAGICGIAAFVRATNGCFVIYRSYNAAITGEHVRFAAGTVTTGKYNRAVHVPIDAGRIDRAKPSVIVLVYIASSQFSINGLHIYVQ